MQLEHWGLERSPFPAVLDVDHCYPSTVHEEALNRIEYLVDARRRLGVVLGEAGVGKSLALRAAARRLVRKGHAAVLVNSMSLSVRELLWQIAAGLGAAPHEDADAARLWRIVADRVVENRLQQESTALLFDDAGQASADVLNQFVRLARLDPTPAARWTIVLAAAREQAARWNESLRELVDLRIDLRPWSEEDTIGYVQTALVDAGRFDPIFDDEALRALYEFSDGVPRRVARLAEFALLAGAAAQAATVDAATVLEANEELRWPEPARMY
jgi:type II secretory pathway predicted ATPase ExeA